MGYIYKISNNVNNKVYIGMTTRSLDIRKADHRKTYNNQNSRMYNLKIYKAMRDIGIENFQYSILEECSNDILSEREKFWIDKYNSVFEGYNTALGGTGKPIINEYQINAMKVLYENGWLLEEIEKAVNVNKGEIGQILHNKFSINTKLNANKKMGKCIIGINDFETIEFCSISDAARYIMSNNISKAQKLACIISKISYALNKDTKTAYKYKWKTL